MNLQEPATLFDYTDLEPSAKLVAREAAEIIRLHARRAAESVVAIGEQLARVKDRLDHGQYLGWLRLEFGWSIRSAQNLMRVWECFKNANFALLEPIDVSALYLLASPSTPEPVREAALGRAATGERVTHASVKDDLRAARERTERAFGTSGRQRDEGSSWSWNDVPKADDDVEPVREDPAKRRAFELAAALMGRLNDFSPSDHDPGEVAQAVDPVLRRRVADDARRVASWLDRFLDELESIRAAA